MNNYVVALYIRLSMEDKQTDSNSIENQKLLLKSQLHQFSEDIEVLEFVDNGYSGTNFERPEMKYIPLCYKRYI